MRVFWKLVGLLFFARALSRGPTCTTSRSCSHQDQPAHSLGIAQRERPCRVAADREAQYAYLRQV